MVEIMFVLGELVEANFL